MDKLQTSFPTWSVTWFCGWNTAENDKFSEHAGISTGISSQPQKAVPLHECTNFVILLLYFCLFFHRRMYLFGQWDFYPALSWYLLHITNFLQWFYPTCLKSNKTVQQWWQIPYDSINSDSDTRFIEIRKLFWYNIYIKYI